ncbi:GAF domain-containing protein [Metabacillus sp. 84]|uniref:GAF domain-containing protein n=1 Tax=unclassified Metabacillus TaxID=2675274 RepID=UPI003CF35E38
MSFEKSYRYEILLQAIEVFTQRYDVHSLLKFAFDFANELLTLNRSALFQRENNHFSLVHTRIYGFTDYTFPASEKLDELPLYHGRPLAAEQLKDYFPDCFIQDFSAHYVIPLINDTVLAGFIVTDGKSMGEMTKDDQISSTIMMSLVNSSLENNQRFLDFQEVNSQLDRKIFNLFVLNQSIKALLSELNVQKLYEMATDVFSEISGSRVTSFGIYDPLSKKIKIKGYRNVHSFQNLYAELEISDPECFSGRTVIHLKEEDNWAERAFMNASALQELETHYVILIQKEKLIGLVTLSDSRQQSTYDGGTIELIETLASSTYIALSNAQLFEKQEKQKKEAEAKLGVLQMYNRLIRTINSCRTREELLNLSLTTLELGFGIKKAFFAFKNGEAYKVAASIGSGMAGESFSFDEAMQEKLKDETHYDFKSDRLSYYFPDERFRAILGESSGVVVSPIQWSTGDFGLTWEHTPYGYLVVTETTENLKEEEIVLIDTITRNITPLIYHMDRRDTLEDLDSQRVLNGGK